MKIDKPDMFKQFGINFPKAFNELQKDVFDYIDKTSKDFGVTTTLHPNGTVNTHLSISKAGQVLQGDYLPSFKPGQHELSAEKLPKILKTVFEDTILKAAEKERVAQIVDKYV